MTNRYKLVVFDWEGTLSDTLGLILNSLDKEARALKLDSPDRHKAATCAGYGLLKAIYKLYPDISERNAQTLVLKVQATLARPSEKVCLFAGARSFIETLHQQGTDLAIATNKGERSLRRDLHESNLESFFIVTRSAGQTAAKPEPEMLEQILAYCDCEAKDALMIGDSISDMEMAKTVSMDAIGMDFYHQQPDRLRDSGALAVFDNYDKLSAFIMRRDK